MNELEQKLIELVAEGLTQREIGVRIGKSQTAVRHQLIKYGLQTHSNRGRRNYIKPRRVCCNCKQEILTKAAKYCSLACQALERQNASLQKWLETGEVANSQFSGQNHPVRKYIREQQDGLCAICKCDQIHNGQQLNFVLDHISGDSEDNTRGNLRLVCPNCDTQLPTYKSKNKGNGRHYRRQRYADGKSF